MPFANTLRHSYLTGLPGNKKKASLLPKPDRLAIMVTSTASRSIE